MVYAIAGLSAPHNYYLWATGLQNLKQSPKSLYEQKKSLNFLGEIKNKIDFMIKTKNNEIYFDNTCGDLKSTKKDIYDRF